MDQLFALDMSNSVLQTIGLDTRPARRIDTQVWIAGRRFDVHAIDALVDWTEEQFDKGRDVIVDLGLVEFIDQHMIGTLVDLHAQAATAGCDLRLGDMSATAALTFELLERVA